jgi:ABC-type transport system involved in cytochrome c biogenesis permease subunit
MNGLPLLLYAAAAAAYIAHFVRREGAMGRVATGTLVAAALAHTFVIGMQTMKVGYVPFVGTTGAISAFVWLLALAYLYTEITTDERAMGVFIAPSVFIAPMLALLQVIPASAFRIVEPPAVLRTPWFAFHVWSLLFAYASFALACVIGITYVLLFKELKTKHLGFFHSRLPSLQVLDTMNHKAVTVGWIFLTIGVLAGALWVTQADVQQADDPRLRAMSLLDPKIFVALICWILYSFQLYARRARGWVGRRAAWLSTFGFAMVMLNFVPVGYFLTRSHDF